MVDGSLTRGCGHWEYTGYIRTGLRRSDLRQTEVRNIIMGGKRNVKCTYTIFIIYY